MKRMKKILALVCVFAMLLSTVNVSVFASETETEAPSVIIIGDSTACNYSSTGSQSFRKGWGQVLHNYFTDEYMIDNQAVSGSSSRSYYNTYWANTKLHIGEGDYVLIQFGHNDSATNNNRYTSPTLDSNAPATSDDDSSYRYYLRQYVTEIRGLGATPIFVTSVPRLNKLSETQSILMNYADAMKAVAAEDGMDVPVIDVLTQAREALNGMTTNGERESWYVVSLCDGDTSGETDEDSSNLNDKTHLVEKGAMAVSKIVAEGLRDCKDASVESLQIYLKSNFTNITNTPVPYKLNETFDFFVANTPISGGNGWIIANGDITKSPYAMVVEESDNKVLKLYRSNDATTGNTTVDSQAYEFRYTVTETFGASSADDVTEDNRYAHFSFDFKKGTFGSGISFMLGNLTFNLEPTKIRMKNCITSAIAPTITYTKDDYDTFDLYFDMKQGRVSVYVNGVQKIQPTLEQVDKSKLFTTFSQIRIQAMRNSTSADSWEYYFDNIKLERIDAEEYYDGTDILPKGTYFKSKFKSDLKTDGWTFKANGNSSVSVIVDPKDTSNNVVEIKQPNTANTLTGITYIFAEGSRPTFANGRYSLKFKVYPKDIKDLFVNITSDDSALAKGYTEPNLSLTGLKQGDWNDVEIVLDFTTLRDGTAKTEFIRQTFVNGIIIDNAYFQFKSNDLKTALEKANIKSLMIKTPSDGAANVQNNASEGYFLLDDIEFKEIDNAKYNTYVKEDNKITKLTFTAGAVPAEAVKFIVASYNEDGSMHGVTVAPALKSTSQTEVILADGGIKIPTNCSAKVFHWNWDTLYPFACHDVE